PVRTSTDASAVAAARTAPAGRASLQRRGARRVSFSTSRLLCRCLDREQAGSHLVKSADTEVPLLSRTGHRHVTTWRLPLEAPSERSVMPKVFRAPRARLLAAAGAFAV